MNQAINNEIKVLAVTVILENGAVICDKFMQLPHKIVGSIKKLEISKI